MSNHVKINNLNNEKICRCFKRCGGCQLDRPYKEQVQWKQEKAERMLSKFCEVQPMITMEDPYNYRNKVQTVYKMNQSKQIISGVYQSSTHGMIAIDDCFLESDKSHRIVSTLKKLMKSFRIMPYNEQTGKGLLRHTLIRTAEATEQVMLVLVTASPVFPSKNNFVKAIRKEHPEITTIVQNICTANTPLILGKRNIALYGKGYIEDVLCGCRFRISPESFYQVNYIQTEKLYSEVVRIADVKKGTRVIDAYCGTGTIGIICAENGAETIGVELNHSAFKDAVTNAKLNKLDNIRFFNADATEFICELAENGEKADVVILDPPRAGSTEDFISSVGKLLPERVVYVSCKIETLERDLKLFKKQGFNAEYIQPVDMFPHTTGIETVVLLKRKQLKIRK